MATFDELGNAIDNSDQTSSNPFAQSQDAMRYALMNSKPTEPTVAPPITAKPVARNRAGQPVNVDPVGTFTGAMTQGLLPMLADASKGTLATMGGIAGDIEGLGRMGINYLAPKVGSDMQVNPETALPTTEDVYNKMPEWYKGQGNYESSVPAKLGSNIVGGIVDPFTAVKAVKAIKATKGLPVGLSIEDVGKGALESVKPPNGALESVKPPKPAKPEPKYAPMNEQGFFSKLDETVLNLPQEKGTGEQMFNMIKQKGIKEEELKFRGFEKWLKEQPKVTKEQMIKYLEENPIDIGEKKLKNEHHADEDLEPDWDTASDDFYNGWERPELDRDAWQEEFDYRYHEDTDLHDEIKDSLAEKYGITRNYFDEVFDENSEMQRKFDDYLQNDAQMYANEYNPTSIRNPDYGYQIWQDGYGGSRLYGPDGDLLNDNLQSVEHGRDEAWNHAVENGHVEPEKLEPELETEYHQYRGVGEGVPSYEEHLYHYHNPDMSDYYNAPHFKDSTDLMMHQRLQDAKTKDGKSVLKVEEQQSDQHQRARKDKEARIEQLVEEGKTKEEANKLVSPDFGYMTSEKKRAYINANNKAETIKTEWNKVSDEYENALALLSNRFADRLEPEERIKAQATLDRLEPIRRQAEVAMTEIYMMQRNMGRVPDAPFKKSYNEFLMKKALFEAASKDKDKLTWTTGKTQAERYNKMLKDNIKELHYTYNPSRKSYDISFVKPDGVMQKYRELPQKDLEDHLGGHIAEQMKSNKENPQVIKGDNISIGTGRGMSGFYDEIQSKFIDNYLKRFGVKTHKDTIVDPNTGREEEVNAIDLTPEMKKEFTTRGQPHFKKGGAVKMSDGGSLAEKANRQLNEEENNGEPSTAWFNLTGGTEMLQNPNIPQGAMQMPPNMAMGRLGHNINGKHGRVNLGATGVSVDTPQGRLNKLAGVDATYEHPSGIYARINKPTGGNMPPRFDIGYRKSFADGGKVQHMSDGGKPSVMETEMAKIQEILEKARLRNELSGGERVRTEINSSKPTAEIQPVKPVSDATVNQEYNARRMKPTVALEPIGIGGSRIPSTQLELFKKKGGKVVSLDEMRYELMRKRNA